MLDSEDALDAIEVGPELVGSELRQAEVTLPFAEHAIGRAVARATVDGRGATDGLAERDRNADVAERECAATAAI